MGKEIVSQEDYQKGNMDGKTETITMFNERIHDIFMTFKKDMDEIRRNIDDFAKQTDTRNIHNEYKFKNVIDEIDKINKLIAEIENTFKEEMGVYFAHSDSILFIKQQECISQAFDPIRNMIDSVESNIDEIKKNSEKMNKSIKIYIWATLSTIIGIVIWLISLASNLVQLEILQIPWSK